MEKIYRNAVHPFQNSVSAKNKIVLGKGNVESCKGKVLVIFDYPVQEEAESGVAVSSQQNSLVNNIFVRSGLEPDKNVFYTYIFKIKPNSNQRITLEDYIQASKIVCDEFDVLKPRIVLAFGIFSTTLAIAAHMNFENLPIEKWCLFKMHEIKRKANNYYSAPGDDDDDDGKDKNEEVAVVKTQEMIDKQAGMDAYQEKMKEQQEVEKAVEKQKKIFNGELKTAPLDPFQMNVIDKNIFMSQIFNLHLLSITKVNNIPQRIYKKNILHCCWGLSLLNPYTIKITNSSDSTKEWITQIEGVKITLLKPPPIILQYVEDIKKKDFEKDSFKETTYVDMTDRLTTKRYRENGKLIRNSLKNGAETISFQINTVEYIRESNEFGIFGKTLDEKSIYCRIPHKHSEFINHFYIKYPKCWRINGYSNQEDQKKKNAYFNYEKNYIDEIANHKSVLKEKTEILIKKVKKRLEIPAFKKDIDAFSFSASSICTKKMFDLTSDDERPDKWTPIDELSNIKLTFERKNTFKSYSTQKRPRIKVEIKFNPYRKLILCCLREMVIEDSKKMLEKLDQKNSTENKSDKNDETSIEEELVNPVQPDKKSNFEDLKVYEIDCSDTQRLNLNNNIYVGGWIEVKGNGYQIVPEEADPCFQLSEFSKKHFKNTYFNGFKKSFCDLEIITFIDEIIGHNPNLELDLKNEKKELEGMMKTIEKSVTKHLAKCNEFLNKSDTHKKSIKYLKWSQIQERRMAHIKERLGKLDEELKKDISKWSKNVCLRTLFIDFECLTNGKTFPTADICPIISIVGYILNIDDKLKITKKKDPQTGKNKDTGLPETWDEVAYFVIGPLDTDEARRKREIDISELGPTKKFNVFSFRTEREMLQAWLVFKSDRNIDLQVGHNIENFDLPFEKKRMVVLKINENAPFKCVYGTKKMFTPTIVEKVLTSSKAFGAKSQSMIDMAGSSCMDTYTIATKEMKESSYTLNYLAKKLFGTKKADCPYEAIPGTFYNDPARLLFYNEKDVAITGRIFNFMNSAINSIEFIKLAGCFKQQECYTRGQQFKVLALVMRIVKTTNVDIPIDAPRNTVANIYQQFDEQILRFSKSNFASRPSTPNLVNYSNTFTNSREETVKGVNHNYSNNSDSEDDDDSSDDDDVEINFKNMTFKRKQKVKKPVAPAPQPLKSIQYKKNFEPPQKKKVVIQKDDKTLQSFDDINSYIDKNVVDQVKRSERAYTYKTKSQAKKEYEKYSASTKKKLTKKEELQFKEATANSHRLTDLWNLSKQDKKDPNVSEKRTIDQIEEKVETQSLGGDKPHDQSGTKRKIDEILSKKEKEITIVKKNPFTIASAASKKKAEEQKLKSLETEKQENSRYVVVKETDKSNNDRNESDDDESEESQIDNSESDDEKDKIAEETKKRKQTEEDTEKEIKKRKLDEIGKKTVAGKQIGKGKREKDNRGQRIAKSKGRSQISRSDLY